MHIRMEKKGGKLLRSYLFWASQAEDEDEALNN
jgi:hypothetical protein